MSKPKNTLISDWLSLECVGFPIGTEREVKSSRIFWSSKLSDNSSVYISNRVSIIISYTTFLHTACKFIINPTNLTKNVPYPLKGTNFATISPTICWGKTKMAPSGETGSRLLQGGPSGLCGGWPGYMLWGTYLGLGRDEVIRPLERTLWGVFRYRNNFFFGRTVLGKTNAYQCIIVHLYIIDMCIMTISYPIICLSSYSLPVYMMPQSVCWFYRFIHLFVYFFAYLKLLDSQSWSIHLKWNLLICIFFKKHANEQFHKLYNPVNDPLCKHPNFSYGPSPDFGDFIAGQKPLCLWKVSCCWLRPRPKERFIPFWYKSYIRSDSIVSMFFLHLFYDVSESCPALIIWALQHWPHVTSATMPRAQVAVLVEICQRPWDKRWAKSGVHASHAMSESPFAATTTTTTTTTTPPPLQLQLSRKLAPRPWPPRLRLALLMVVGPQKQKWDVSTYASVLQPGHGFNKALLPGRVRFGGVGNDQP